MQPTFEYVQRYIKMSTIQKKHYYIFIVEREFNISVGRQKPDKKKTEADMTSVFLTAQRFTDPS